jgi:hypothetical protein
MHDKSPKEKTCPTIGAAQGKNKAWRKSALLWFEIAIRFFPTADGHNPYLQAVDGAQFGGARCACDGRWYLRSAMGG